MNDSDEDVIPCDDGRIHFATAELQDDDASSYHSNPPLPDNPDDSSVTLEGSAFTEDSAEGLPPAIQNNLSGVPRKIRFMMGLCLQR
jgi:hypothetical protein